MAVIRSASAARKVTPVLEYQIDNYIRQVYLPEAHVSSLGIAIVSNDGGVLYTNGYGWANQEKFISNTNETQFNLGSSTKVNQDLLQVNHVHKHALSLRTLLRNNINTVLIRLRVLQHSH